jgi:peptide-methionine (S)-S-oxide reductase
LVQSLTPYPRNSTHVTLVALIRYNNFMTGKQLETATLAGGCFWCTEAVFRRLKGIETVHSGYAGGDMEDPSYEAVHGGDTGHAEAIQVTFDPTIISFRTLLDVFFATHDPTTLNRDGANIGEEYRSEVFYHTDEQKKITQEKMKELDEKGPYKDPIVTQVAPYSNFYPAEDEHDQFYEKNRNYGYCRIIIDPKIQKLLKEFSKEVKEEYKESAV